MTSQSDDTSTDESQDSELEVPRAVQVDNAIRPCLRCQIRRRIADPFEYTRIDPWQTRLLRLHGGAHKDLCRHGHAHKDLYADLVDADLVVLDGAVIQPDRCLMNYTALSYCWGSSKRDEFLRLNGLLFPITESLHAALSNLRDAEAKDNDEKSFQVANMLRIYQKASKVHAWLGQEADDSKLAIRALTHRDATIRICSSRDRLSKGRLQSLRRLHSSLIAFYSRPWFRRIWIRQESYAASTLEIGCGPHVLALKDVIEGFRLIGTLEGLLEKKAVWFRRCDESIADLVTELNSNTQKLFHLTEKPPRDLLDVLLTTRYFETTLQLDRIYAILGMCAVPNSASNRPIESSMQGVRIDYGKSLAEVLQDVTMYLLWTSVPLGSSAREMYEGLSTLLTNRRTALSIHDPAQATSISEQDSDSVGITPSWAIDWQTSCYSKDEIREMDNCEWRFRSNDRIFADLHAWLPPRIEGNTLCVCGLLLGCVIDLHKYTCQLSGVENAGRHDSALHLNLIKMEGVEPFDPSRHCRRLAILQIRYLYQLALVPADTEVEDFIVVLAPKHLPLVISPTRTGALTEHHIQAPGTRELVRAERAVRIFAQLLSLENPHGRVLKLKGPAFTPIQKLHHERKERIPMIKFTLE